MGGIGTVFGFLVQPIIDLTSQSAVVQRNDGFILVSIFMLVCLVILFVCIHETPTGTGFFKVGDHSIKIDPVSFEIQPSTQQEITIQAKQSRWNDIINVFQEKEKSAIFMLLAIFMWFFGYNAIETFFSLFATQYLGISRSTASIILIILPVALILAAYPAGLLGIKFGR